MNNEHIPEGYFDDDWKLRAACRDDERFISKPATIAAKIELINLCVDCPVFDRCKEFVDEYEFPAVFAAGQWRGSDICVFESA